MKTIKLTSPNGKPIIVAVDNIFSIKPKRGGGSFITSNGGDIANVIEPPDIIEKKIREL